MKKQIELMAMIFFARKGVATNLEIKNALHKNFDNDPTFSLTQKEVSDMMAELYVENGWHRNLHKGNGQSYYEYSDMPFDLHGKTPDATAISDGGSPLPSTNNISLLIAAGYKINHTVVSDGSKQLDSKNGEWVFYVAGKPEKYVQVTKKLGGRKECFQKYDSTEFGLTYDNINACKVDYFNRHKASAL